VDAASSSKKPESLSDEEVVVRQRRYFEALDAGLDEDQAEDFSRNKIDIGQLRKLVEAGVAPSTIAAIVL
jgi:hypothetical protein